MSISRRRIEKLFEVTPLPKYMFTMYPTSDKKFRESLETLHSKHTKDLENLKQKFLRNKNLHTSVNLIQVLLKMWGKHDKEISKVYVTLRVDIIEEVKKSINEDHEPSQK